MYNNNGPAQWLCASSVSISEESKLVVRTVEFLAYLLPRVRVHAYVGEYAERGIHDLEILVAKKLHQEVQAPSLDEALAALRVPLESRQAAEYVAFGVGVHVFF